MTYINHVSLLLIQNVSRKINSRAPTARVKTVLAVIGKFNEEIVGCGAEPSSARTIYRWKMNISSLKFQLPPEIFSAIPVFLSNSRQIMSNETLYKALPGSFYTLHHGIDITYACCLLLIYLFISFYSSFTETLFISMKRLLLFTCAASLITRRIKSEKSYKM